MTAIPKNIYQALTQKQRAVALYIAIKREDQAEIDRLKAHTPKGEFYGQSILPLSLAVRAYNEFESAAIIELLKVNTEYLGALYFCLGWVTAGGELDNAEYLEKLADIKKLTPVLDNCFGEVQAVRAAALEWCSENAVAPEAISHDLRYIAQETDDNCPVDEDFLFNLRRIFNSIKL